MKIGVTATRKGLTGHQIQTTWQLLVWNEPEELIHGGCINGDEQLAKMASELGIWTHELPGNMSKLRTQFVSDETHHPQNNLKRNRQIVRIATHMLACPSGHKEIMRGSGTWATIRYALELEKPLVVIWPDEGSYRCYNGGEKLFTKGGEK